METGRLHGRGGGSDICLLIFRESHFVEIPPLVLFRGKLESE